MANFAQNQPVIHGIGDYYGGYDTFGYSPFADCLTYDQQQIGTDFNCDAPRKVRVHR